MKTIVFFSIPAHGHTNPTLAVVRELIARGHTVRYYSYEMMRDKITSTGAHFIPCDSFDRELALKPRDSRRIGKDLAFSTKILVDTTLSLDEAILADMEKLHPDCIVSDSMALWGKAIARKLEIPYLCSTTTFAFNEHSAKVMKQGPLELLKLLLALPNVNRQLNRLQKKGYPFRTFLDIVQNDNETHTIVYTSPEFQPNSETFSSKYVFVGPSIRPKFQEIQKKSDILVYISMGTVNNALLPLYRNCLEALADTGYHIILSVGENTDLEGFGPQPKTVELFHTVDQIAVLEKADVFLTHCGMNSVNEALYFGVPLLMHPITQEQKGVANRVSQLGAGILLEHSSSLSIRQAVSQILSDPSYRINAMTISQSFHRCTGATGAADKILSLCTPE